MSFAAFGRFAVRRRKLLVLAALALCLLAVGVNLDADNQLSSSGLTGAATESVRAAQIARERVGRGVADVVVVFRSDSRQAADPMFRQEVDEALASVPGGIVAGTVTPWSLGQPGLVAADGRAVAALLTIHGDNEDDRQRNFQRLQRLLHPDDLHVSFAGTSATISDLVDRSQHNLLMAELAAIPLMAILLLLVFRSVLAAALPVAVGGLAVLMTFAVLRLLTPIIDVSVLALNAVSVLTLALNVDAALVVVSRFREELAALRSVREAVEVAIATAGRAVCLSTLTIAVVSIGMTFSGIGVLVSIGLGLAIAQLIGAVLTVTLLPALLAVMGTRVGLPAARGRRRMLALIPEGGGWLKLAATVMAKPLSYLVISTSLLAILAAPLMHAHFNAPDRAMLPSYAPPNMALEDLRQNFGLASGEQIQVVTTFAQSLTTAEGQQNLRQWRYLLAAVPNVSSVAVAATSETTAVIYVGRFQAARGAYQDGAKQVVREIRQLPAPAGGEVLVGGEAAVALDTMDLLAQRTPLMAGYIIVVILLLLMLALRSVILPIKAVLMAVISTSTALGVTVWAFQDGHLNKLTGHPPSSYIEILGAIVMVMILIGISIDYTFVLLSRIREEYIAGGNAEVAIAQGLQRSGRVITAAALTVMVVTVVFFIVSEVESNKQLCLGLFVAVFIDVTLVRMLLLPASMKLLGRANWWWPGSNARHEARTAVPLRRDPELSGQCAPELVHTQPSDGQH